MADAVVKPSFIRRRAVPISLVNGLAGDNGLKLKSSKSQQP
jgi:hypothetical protein